MKYAAFVLILMLGTTCYGITIKATGYARARIIAPAELDVSQATPSIVYTAVGATSQVVF